MAFSIHHSSSTLSSIRKSAFLCVFDKRTVKWIQSDRIEMKWNEHLNIWTVVRLHKDHHHSLIRLWPLKKCFSLLDVTHTHTHMKKRLFCHRSCLLSIFLLKKVSNWSSHLTYHFCVHASVCMLESKINSPFENLPSKNSNERRTTTHVLIRNPMCMRVRLCTREASTIFLKKELLFFSGCSIVYFIIRNLLTFKYGWEDDGR